MDVVALDFADTAAGDCLGVAPTAAGEGILPRTCRDDIMADVVAADYGVDLGIAGDVEDAALDPPVDTRLGGVDILH